MTINFGWIYERKIGTPVSIFKINEMEKIIATYHEQNVDGHDSNGNPSRIYFMNGYMTTYTYSATGQKLAVGHFVALPNVTWEFGVKPNTSNHTAIFAGHTDYLLGGSLIVQEGTTRMLLFDGGYAKAERTGSNSTNYGYTLFYYTQDHLGNNREVISANGALKQKTNYYPFGAIMTDISSNQDIQPYKYNGKELDLMHGLNTYDYGARQYYSILGRWDRIDPLCEKYYSLSPYNYCGNNPINAIDEKGDSVCVLNLGNGTNQHLAMLIQNDKGTWSYYSFNGTSIYSSTSGSVGGAPHNNLGEKTFVSPMAFLNSQYNSDGSKGLIERDKINGYGYTEGYILPTSPKEDIVIRDNFVKTVNDGYNLISNQCADAVKNALNSVGIDTSVFNYDVSIPLPGKNSPNIPLLSIKIEPYLPSKTFEAIMSNNDGVYIKK